jgi:hypothetical protein
MSDEPKNKFGAGSFNDYRNSAPLYGEIVVNIV